MNQLQQAAALAATFHEGQWYGHLPYIVHVSEVVRNLQEFHYDEQNILIAGFLHDAIEDCGQEASDVIKEAFDESVFKLVDAVSGVGKNRKERKHSMLLKLVQYPKAIPLKMADRLANIRNCVRFNPRLLEMYKKEFRDYDEMFEAADPLMNVKIRDIIGWEDGKKLF